jgi:hypothetical protein
MSAKERLRALANGKVETWYPHPVCRELDEDFYNMLLSVDPSTVLRIGHREYKIDLIADDCIFTLFRHLED